MDISHSTLIISPLEPFSGQLQLQSSNFVGRFQLTIFLNDQQCARRVTTRFLTLLKDREKMHIFVQTTLGPNAEWGAGTTNHVKPSQDCLMSKTNV
jgi:hypothetical protein